MDEDIYLEASLECIDGRVISVPCKVYLPKLPMGKPYFIFNPKDDQFNFLSKIRNVNFRASLDGFNSKSEITLSAPSVWLSSKKTRHLGPNISESRLKGEPQGLRIIKQIGLASKSKDLGKVHLRIWVSPNAYLDPDISPEYSYTGEVKYNRFDQIQCKISDKLTIKFDRIFKYLEKSETSVIQNSYLIAYTEINSELILKDAIDEEIFEPIDMFLKLASLGSRTRTACLGFDAESENQIVTIYRSNLSYPSGKSEFMINCAFPEDFKKSQHTEGLIDKKHFSDFLDTSLNNLKTASNPKAVLDAINSVVPGRKRTLEESFLSMFSNFEALLLDFRKSQELEYVVNDKSGWGQKKKKIRKAIKEIFDDYSKEKRSFIYCKIDELNRIPLRIIYDKFCSHYHLDTSDLWPIFGKTNIVGLVDIRNRLIHGTKISNKFIHMLSVSTECLQYTVERMILKILNYSLDKTDVSKSKISYDQYRAKWSDEEMVKFKNYIESL